MPVTEAKIGYGTILEWGDNGGLITIVELTRIGAVTLSASKQDATTLGSPDYYKDILPGLIDPGDVAIEGLFRPDDPGQYALMTDMNSRTKRDFKVSFPTALSTTTWTGKAYCTGFVAGDATPEGIIPFSATLSIVGKPRLNVTLSAGMTVLVAEEEDTTNIPYLPACAVGTYNYVANGPVDTTCTYVKLTITAAGVITVTVLGVEHILSSTFKSEAIVIDDATKVTPIYIKVQETGESPRNYTLWIQRT